MSDLSLDQNSKLAQLKAEREAKKQAAMAPAPAEPATVDLIKVQTPEPPKPDKQEEAVPPVEPVIDTKKAEASTTTPAPSKEEEPEFEWDSNLSVPEPATTSASADFKKIGSALGLEATSEEELVKVASEKLSKLKTLEEQSQKVFENVPDSLKEAIEVAKKGGDWKSFIGTTLVDPSKLDPIQVFEEQYEKENAYRFKKPDGSIDYDALDAELDSISVGLKQMNGSAIISQVVAKQNQQKQAVLAVLQQQQENFSKQLSEAAKELPTLLPQSEFGVTLEPKHISHIQNGATTGTLLQKHLGNIDPSILVKMDAKKLLKTLALAEYGQAMAKTRYKQGVTAGKRELLDSTQNPQIQTVGSVPVPESTSKPKTATEQLMDFVSKQKPANSL